jgi:hypothetical protein
MKCYKCNKPIPSVSTICPYCSAPVDPNYREPIDFGDISNSDYDSKNDLKAYIQEPKNRKVVIIGISTIILVIIVFAALLLSVLKPHNTDPHEYFESVISNLNDIIYDNFLGSNNAFSAEYKLDIDINGENIRFNGNYERDINSRILKIDGTMSDPEETNGGVVIDSKDFSFSSYLKDNNLYFKSEQLFNDYLYFNIDDETGLLTTKNYSLDLLINGISDALVESIKNTTINSTKESINYRGVETSTHKYYITLDNKAKIEFFKSFYTTLMDDANFLNEYARISDKKVDEVVEILNNKISDAEFRYSSDSDNDWIFAIYVVNKKIIRYYVDINDDKHETYTLEVKDDKYYFDYDVDGKNVISASLLRTTETISDETKIIYSITFDSDEYVMDINLELKVNDNALVKRQDIETYTDVSTLTDENIATIKNNLSYYTSNTELIDTIRDKFKDKCTLGLECNCEESSDTCSCILDNKIITCDKNKVTETIENDNNNLE